MHRKSKHHRKCVSRGGKTTHRNISIVQQHVHESWHNLFENKRPQEIADLINDVWLDPDYMFLCVLRRPTDGHKDQLRLDI